MYRYLEDRIIPPTAVLARGTAVHNANEFAYKEKLESGTYPKREDILQVCSDEFDKAAQETVGRRAQKDEMKDQSISMAGCYHDNIASKIEPESTEEWFDLDFFGLSLVGKIDLTTKDQIRETKTRNRNITRRTDDIQKKVYSLVKPDKKELVTDILVPKSSGETECHSYSYKGQSEQDFRLVSGYVESFIDSNEKGLFLPADPDSWVCSQKWCGYWNICPFGKGGK